jgi:lysophospholipase L1-like esterase
MSPPNQPVRRTRRLRAAVFGVAAALACGEVGLRVLGYTPHFVNPIASFHVPDEEIGLRGRPGFSGRFAQTEFDVRIELDERGFRRVDTSIASAGQQIFVLGDSFTWGWGVDQGEGFVDMLANAFPDTRVTNLGLSGTGTVVAHRLLERHVLPELRRGDVVLLVPFENDLADNLGRNHDRWMHATVEDGAVSVVPAPTASHAGEVKNWFKQHSCLFNLAVFVADRLKLARKQERSRLDGEAGKERAFDADEEMVYAHFLAQIRAAVTARGAAFGVACIPPRSLYEGDTPDREVPTSRHAAVLDAPRRLGIPTLDLLSALSAPVDENAEPLTFAFDEHWTATGHRVAADAMIPFVADLLGKPAEAGFRRR